MKTTFKQLLLVTSMLAATAVSYSGVAQTAGHDGHDDQASHAGHGAGNGQSADNGAQVTQHQGDGTQTRMQQRQGNGQGGMMQQGGGSGQGGMMQQGGGNGQGEMMQRMERMRAMLGIGQANAGSPDAFTAIRNVVQQLEANPETDWSTINIDALRNHLIDMHELTINAAVTSSQVDGGATYQVTGAGRTLEAIRRMVPTHAAQIVSETGWATRTREIDGGVEVTVTAEAPEQVARIRALGFAGFMVSGEHHDAHHLAIVGGKPQDMAAGGAGHSH